MKNKTTLYLTSAFLWLGVAFSSLFIYQNSKKQEVEIIDSAQKIDDLHQDFYEMEYIWWERSNLASLFVINKKHIETLHDLEIAKQNAELFKSYYKLSFLDIEPKLPKLNERNKNIYMLSIKKLISNEELHLQSTLNRKLYKNIILQKFREKWVENRRDKIYSRCIWGGPTYQLNLFSDKKIALSINDFNEYRVGYFSFPKNMEEGIFTNSNKDFEFEVTIKTLDRNPKTTTKRYKTTPKKGQELKPFDYEEIE